MCRCKHGGGGDLGIQGMWVVWKWMGLGLVVVLSRRDGRWFVSNNALAIGEVSMGRHARERVVVIVRIR